MSKQEKTNEQSAIKRASSEQWYTASKLFTTPLLDLYPYCRFFIDFLSSSVQLETGKQATITQANGNGCSSKWAITNKWATDRNWASKWTGKQERDMRANQMRELWDMWIRKEDEKTVTVFRDTKKSDQKKASMCGRSEYKRANKSKHVWLTTHLNLNLDVVTWSAFTLPFPDMF